MNEENKNRLVEFYTEQRFRIENNINLYRKNYGIEKSSDELRGICFDEYEKARFNICGIENESERMQQTALLRIRRLNGQIDSLDKVFEELKNE